LHPIWEGSIGWVATKRHSLKARHLRHNPYVSLAYIADVTRPVYVDCEAEWEEDLASKRRIWEMFCSAEPPLGYDPAPFFGNAEDADFGLLKLTPWRIEIDSYGESDVEKQRIWRR
jgi:general stress protein 26